MIGKYRKVHFIGIGGIGISAIAKMMLIHGVRVSGSDGSRSKVTDNLKKEGVKIYIGHSAKNVPLSTDLVIYTIAIPKNNPELVKAHKLGIKTLSYPEALGEISRTKKTIAISGTHGKTTTTAMIADILITAKKKPTVIIGSFLDKNRGNFIAGNGEYLVAEACEYRRSFLNLSPNILVITNIDNDHLDYYRDMRDIQNAFLELTKKVPKDGFVICAKKNKLVVPIIAGLKCKVVDYKKIDSSQFKLHVPGKHNVENAQAAFAVGKVVGVKASITITALNNFSGTWRRQEYKGKTKKGALIYDDYAHHPTEVAAAISAFKDLHPNKKISVVFQPHLYSRTKLLLNDFARELSRADGVIITDIYSAREKKDPKISGKILAEEIKKKKNIATYIKSFKDIERKLKIWADDDDVIITMGAGDVYKVGEQIVST